MKGKGIDSSIIGVSSVRFCFPSSQHPRKMSDSHGLQMNGSKRGIKVSIISPAKTEFYAIENRNKLFHPPLQLLIILHEESIVPHETIETLTRIQKFFRNAIYGNEMSSICNNFYFPCQHNGRITCTSRNFWR